MEVKKLEDYSFVEIIDMKKGDFEKSFEVSAMNLGQIESLRKLLSLQFEAMGQQVKDLNDHKQRAEESNDTETAKTAQGLIEQISSLMFSMEYKATLLYNRSQKLIAEAQ